jgi:hypothetical protein
MIETIQDAIIAALENVEGVAAAGVWQGDIDDLLKTPQKLPSLSVVYQGAEFGERKTIGATIALHRMVFLVVLAARNLRSREEGATACYGIIEGVRGGLIGLQIAPWGWLWPISEELILAEGGLLVYGLRYRMNTEVTI